MIGGDKFRERLEGWRGSRIVILGVGNTLKGDDGFGPLVCAALANKVAARVIDAGTVPENHLRPLIQAGPQLLLVIDAVDFGGAPGAVGVFTLDQINDVAFSTHALSLRLFVDVLRTEIEVDVLLLGVQPIGTQLGQSVSAPVQASIREVAETLITMLPPAECQYSL